MLKLEFLENQAANEQILSYRFFLFLHKESARAHFYTLFDRTRYTA